LADVELSGLAGALSLDLGGSIGPDFVLHGRFSSMTLVDPSESVDGEEIGRAYDLRADAWLLGPAATFYFMPANVYVTAAVGFAWHSVHFVDEDAELSDTGIGFNLDAGKEWWVAPDWGIGVAARFWFSYVEDDIAGVGDTKDAFSGVALLFSATYQ
jgi:hypothetical protein